MYIVVEKNYLTLVAKQVYKTYGLEEAHSCCETYGRNFVELKEGETNSQIFYNKEPKRGYYLKKSKNFNKVSIYRKTIKKGIFANETIREKILSYQVVKIEPTDFEIFDYNFSGNSELFDLFITDPKISELISSLQTNFQDETNFRNKNLEEITK